MATSLKKIKGVTGEFVGPSSDELTSYGHFYVVRDGKYFGVIVNHGGFAAAAKFNVNGELFMQYGFVNYDSAMAVITEILKEIRKGASDEMIFIR